MGGRNRCTFRFQSKKSSLNILRCAIVQSADSDGKPIYKDVPRINKIAPISDFESGESFKLVYNKNTKLVTLSNNRGFSYSVSYCADGHRFVFQIKGYGVSLLNIKEKEDDEQRSKIKEEIIEIFE